MPKIIDSIAECKMLYNSPTQNESVLILLRSKLSAIAQRIGFSERKKENMLLVASELATNNIKHAGGRGMIQFWQQPGPVLDIVSIDYGPGIANLPNAEEDGFSTTNTLGKGLGTFRRLSDESHIYSQVENAQSIRKWSGTAFLSRFHLSEPAAGPAIGLFSRSLSDQRYNGDRIYIDGSKNKLRWLHMDGLGHGEEAQTATSNLATHLSHCSDLESLLTAVDRQLSSTRGAVAVFGEIDPARHKIELHGVGDMHAHIYAKEQMHHFSFAPGILGREHRSSSPTEIDFDKKSLVISASDGIRRNWDLANFTGLFNQHPQLIAYALGNIMGRISDDQSIFVATAE